jgi:hypothetical protein
MGLRNFRDTDGNEWRVWDVHPYGTLREERRVAERRRAPSVEYTGPERRSGTDRRGRGIGLFTPGLESGWLCFENSALKRRLTPIPQGWDDAPEDQLEELMRRAYPVLKRS